MSMHACSCNRKSGKTNLVCVCPRIPRMHAFHDYTCACVCFILATSLATRISHWISRSSQPLLGIVVVLPWRLKGTQRNWGARRVDLALADGRPWKEMRLLEVLIETRMHREHIRSTRKTCCMRDNQLRSVLIVQPAPTSHVRQTLNG